MNNELKPSKPRRRWLKGCAWGCGGMLAFFLLLMTAIIFLLRGGVPKSYPPLKNPLAPPLQSDYAAFALDGAESPYLGHTGSWNGKGGTITGGSKGPDLDKEAAMGLRWTFMEVRWRALEPQGPVDLAQGIPPAWRELDAFVIEAHQRKLNILMQAPVMGGNGGGPPDWAGRREPGKSAPAKMDAAAAFAGKLAERYAPGGTLATRQGWGQQYGVRAWELDNEPESYRTHWKGQAGDYAEFATQAAAQIRRADARAVIVLPGSASGHAAAWLDALLDAHALSGSPEYRKRAVPHSIGPVADVISFHVYEGLDTAFAGKDRTIERVWSEIRNVVEKWETGAAGFHYARKREYWHTEGNFDFIGVLSKERRAAWRMQFFTRAFAAGIRKICVMDASPVEQIAVRSYVEALPWPFPMHPADDAVKVLSGQARVFRHLDSETPEAGQVWVLWATAHAGDAEVEVPVAHESITLVQVDGAKRTQPTPTRRVRVKLKGDDKMAPPVLIIDRMEGQSTLSAPAVSKEKDSPCPAQRAVMPAPKLPPKASSPMASQPPPR